MIVCINAGHGGHDPGAIGSSGLKEKDINLKIANIVTKDLKRNNINVISTRTTDTFVSLADTVLIANTNKVNLFVSIHVNSATNTSANYISTFIIGAGGEAEKAAKLIQDKIVSITGFRNGGVKIGNLYVLKETKMPAVLVENGFISNVENEKWLSNDINLEKLAKATTKGICEYLGVDYKEEIVSNIDQPSNWAKEIWQDAVKKGYTDGTRPRDKITREETMAMIYKILKLK